MNDNMSGLVAAFEAWAATATPQAKADVLRIIEQQTQMTAAALEHVTKGVMAVGYNDVWKGLLDKRNLEIEELLTIENLLHPPAS